jgi:hypothetical protein
VFSGVVKGLTTVVLDPAHARPPRAAPSGASRAEPLPIRVPAWALGFTVA